MHGNGSAEARTDGADTIGVDGGMLGEKRQRIGQILNLLEADDAAELAFALAAAAHVEAQRDIAEFAQDPRRLQYVVAFAIRAKAVQHQKGSATLRRRQTFRQAEHAVQAQARGLKIDNLFFHAAPDD